MPKCVIDGKEVEFKPGETIMTAAERVGVVIPHFCYHPALSVTGQCRMCAVEVEKTAKPQMACSSVAQDGMVVHTKTELVRQQQRATMEFLLINHPLDCPVCDKAGECKLQDFSYQYGDAYSRYKEERRTFVDLDMGPVIRKNMNRCIHCMRCVRFAGEITKKREMGAFKRGNNTEISTLPGRQLETAYAGCYADLCPTGALTLKDFRFKKRVWLLKRKASVCEGCSRGCNIEIHYDDSQVHRCVPRLNNEINKYWLCDEGRFLFRKFQSPERVVSVDWDASVARARELLRDGKFLVLAGTDLTQEEAALLQEFTLKFKGAALRSFGTPGISLLEQDGAADFLLKRKSRTANLHGFAGLGIKPFSSDDAGFKKTLLITAGQAELPAIRKGVVAIGVFNKKEASAFEAVLPSLGPLERDGTVVNCDGRMQKVVKAVSAPGGCRQLEGILKLLKETS